MHLSTLAVALCAAFHAATPAFAQGTSSTTTIKPGAVTSKIAPPNQTAPPGCSPNYSGTFQIGPVNVSSSSKRDLSERNTMLGITLVDGVLTDPYGRTGYIASNSQFQFDGPPQAGAIYTAGFSVCENGSLALGSDVTWYSCLSGTFFNLYLDSIGGQCVESYIVTYPVGDGYPLPVTASAGSATITSTGTSSAASSLSNATMTTSSSNRTASMTLPRTTTTRASRSIQLSSETNAVAPTSASAASSPTASPGAAAHAAGLGRAMLGLAGGLFAFVLV